MSGFRFGKMTDAMLQPGFRAGLKPDGTLEILIYEEIGEDYWSYDGGVTAKTIKQQIEAAGNYAGIRMRINSPGGDAFEGIAIYNLIRSEKKPVEVCVDGIAASSASIVAMCGDTITMGPNALMMIHNAWTWCMGYASDMRKMADALDKISGAIAQTYVTRTKKSTEEITALMDAETWLTAQECLVEGFCTQITSEPAIEENALAMARQFKSLGKLKKVPDRLKQATAVPKETAAKIVAPKAESEPDVCECPCEACVEGRCADCSNAECDDSNCTNCPMQETSAASRLNLNLFQAQQWELEHGVLRPAARV